MFEQWPDQPGVHDLRESDQAGAAGQVSVSLPVTATAGVPLVLVLHYGGEPQGFYGRALLEMLVGPAWAELGAVMIAPVAAGGDWTTARNRAFALAAMEAFEHHYHTNPAQRVLVGYSMGAIGVWHFLGESVAEFSAAIAIAGPAPELDLATTVPVTALNSGGDRLFPLASTASAVADLANRGLPIRLSTIEGVDHFNVAGFRAGLERLLPWVRECLSG